jgi:hypothetical protein
LSGKDVDPSTTLSRMSIHSNREGGFRTLAPSLRQVTWPDKFKPKSIDKYDGLSNPKEFIQVYHTVIEATVGDDRVNANYLLMTLSGAARS